MILNIEKDGPAYKAGLLHPTEQRGNKIIPGDTAK